MKTYSSEGCADAMCRDAERLEPPALGYEAGPPLDAAAEIERLRAALKDIQAKAVQMRPPRYSWFYDKAEEALRGDPKLSE